MKGPMATSAFLLAALSLAALGDAEHSNHRQKRGGDYHGDYGGHKKMAEVVEVPVPEPYPVYVEKKVPVEVVKTVEVPVPEPYPVFVEKKVPVKVPVPEPYPVPVPKPYPVAVQKPVPYPVPVPVKPGHGGFGGHGGHGGYGGSGGHGGYGGSGGHGGYGGSGGHGSSGGHGISGGHGGYGKPSHPAPTKPKYGQPVYFDTRIIKEEGGKYGDKGDKW